MKTKFNVALLCSILIFSACKKEAVYFNDSSSSKLTQKAAFEKSDGILNVKAGILPPVTQKQFITNGSYSSTQFQITASKRILLVSVDFSAPYPLVQLTTASGFSASPDSCSNVTGTMSYYPRVFINAGSGIPINMKVFYNNVKSITSGSVAHVSLTHIQYKTEDFVTHDFYPSNNINSQSMCLVTNIPEINFQNPLPDTMKNGYKEFALIKLSGDKSWTLNELPLNIALTFGGAQIKKAEIIVKSKGEMLSTKSDSIEINGTGNIQTVIHFTGGFHHEAGKTETLKLFAPVLKVDYVMTTSMNPLNLFTWTDSSGVKISGSKNNNFFKQETGISNLLFF